MVDPETPVPVTKWHHITGFRNKAEMMNSQHFHIPPTYSSIIVDRTRGLTQLSWHCK